MRLFSDLFITFAPAKERQTMRLWRNWQTR